MGRAIGNLTALKVAKAGVPGMYADGGGLYLRITREKTKNWVFRFMLNGRPRWMGMGPLHTITLAEARSRAAECRKQRHDGIDPIEARRAAKQQVMLEAARSFTFRKCVESYIDAHCAGWSNAKHAAQWKSTLATYAEAKIGALPVQAIDTDLVLKVLQPIWTTKPETASRVRGRIEAVLDWAKARDYRGGENPARWRGHLDKLLPARAKVRKVKHHAALPYPQIGEFMAALRLQSGVAARALEFTILTAARTGETIGARWSEIDIDGKRWTIAGDRMKAGREHRVPLCTRALEIVRSMKKIAGPAVVSNAFVFASSKSDRSLSNMAFLMLLRRMERSNLTVHGFRSSFRDWVAERTRYPNEVAELALAHTVPDKVEAAYRRGDMFDHRRRLMEEWAKFCDKFEDTSSSKIVSIATAVPSTA